MSFEGKTVLITGSSSGIGADAARHLAKLRAEVAIVGRNEKRLNEVAAQIKSFGSDPLVIVADVSKDAERIVNETIRRFGKLDVLVNNAGFGLRDNIVDANLSDFDRVFDTNVRAVIQLTKLCVPHLEKTKGNIVNVSSVLGLKVIPCSMTYCMSKAAIDQFTKCCAVDLAPKGIRVNAINPAAIRTLFLEALGVPREQSDAMYDGMTGLYLTGRIGDVSDTSYAIAYLADNKIASFLTGLLHTVDGGFMLTQ